VWANSKLVTYPARGTLWLATPDVNTDVRAQEIARLLQSLALLRKIFLTAYHFKVVRQVSQHLERSDHASTFAQDFPREIRLSTGVHLYFTATPEG
jgi:hypothetical protein